MTGETNRQEGAAGAAGWWVAAGVLAWMAIAGAAIFSFCREGMHLAEAIPAAREATRAALAGLQAGKLAAHALDLALALIFFWVVAGPGEWALRAVGAGGQGRFGRGLYATAAGCGIFSLAVLAAGLLGALTPAVMWLLFALASAARVASWIFSRKNCDSPDTPGGADTPGADRPLPVEYLLFAAGACGLLVFWVAAASPVHDPDSLMYHMALPKIYLDAGRIFYVPYILHSNWPLLPEMLFTWALGAGGEGLAKMVAFALGLLACGAAWHAGRCWGGRAAGLWSAGIFLSIPLVYTQGAITAAEMAVCFFEVLAVCALVEWDRGGGRPELALSALCSGLALSCKLLAGVSLCVLAACVLWRGIARGGGVRRAACGALAYLSIGVAVPLPWFIKSMVWTGNPVWPFLYGIFGGKNWNELVGRDYFHFVHSYYEMIPLDRIHEIFGFLAFNLFDWSAGLLVALAAPLVVYGAWRVRRGTGLYLAAAFVAWALLSQQPRFVIPVLAVGAALAGAGAARLPRAARWISASAAVAVQLVTLVWAWTYFAPLYGVSIGDETREEFLSRMPVYNASVAANTAAGEDSRALLMWTSVGYFLDMPYVWGDPTDQGMFDYCGYSSPGEFSEDLERLGVTHVMFHMFGLQQKVKVDQRTREKLGLGPRDPTVVRCAAEIENELIESDKWWRIYQSPSSAFFVFEIIDL